MSTGPRIPLARALAIAESIMRLWGLDSPACQVVGSVRRAKADVGDIELIAPLPECLSRPYSPMEEPEKPSEDNDPVYARIRATTERTPTLFDPSPPPPVARIVQGLSPGFREASLEVNLRAGLSPGNEPTPVRVQVFRYVPSIMHEGKVTPSNRGWIELLRTGPQDFGIEFLQHWRQRFGIAGERKASIDGWLVDSYGTRVPTPTEDDCFRIAGRPFVPPAEREAWAARSATRNAQHQREVMR